MSDQSRLSLALEDLPLTPFGMKGLKAKTNITDQPHGQTKSSKLRLPSAMQEIAAGPLLPKRTNGKENEFASKINHANITAAGTIRNKLLESRKPLSSMNLCLKMPALEEENQCNLVSAKKKDDKPLSPGCESTPINARDVSIDTTPAKANHERSVKSNENPTHKIKTLGQHNVYKTADIRNCRKRESVMTDIDEGSFIEFTSEVPDGRIIPHIDSVVNLRNNLYFTCPDFINETEYSTSSKCPTARFGFHAMVAAIKKQDLQPQISEEAVFTTSSMTPRQGTPQRIPNLPTNPVPVSKVTKILPVMFNSTMVDGKGREAIPFSFPDISSLTLIDAQDSLVAKINSGMTSEVPSNVEALPSSSELRVARNVPVHRKDDALTTSADHGSVARKDSGSTTSDENVPDTRESKIAFTRLDDIHQTRGNEISATTDGDVHTTRNDDVPATSDDDVPATSDDADSATSVDVPLALTVSHGHKSVKGDKNEKAVKHSRCIPILTDERHGQAKSFSNMMANKCDALFNSTKPTGALPVQQKPFSNSPSSSSVTKLSGWPRPVVSNIHQGASNNKTKLPHEIFLSKPGPSTPLHVCSKGVHIGSSHRTPLQDAAGKLTSPAVSTARKNLAANALIQPKVPNKIATHGQKVDAVDSIPVSLAPSSSVCNWVLNSPFKDSSFGTSFVMPSGRSGVGTNYVEESDSELNNSSSADDSNSRVELFTEKTKKVVEFNNRSSDEDDEKTSADDPATKPATNVNPSLDSEKLIEESLNMESLKLRLEGSARSNGTAFTLGRIAESGKMAASSKNEIKVPSNVKTPRNVHLNLAHNFFVTERRKKKKTVQTESSERPSNTINDEMDKCETVKNEKREIASKTASASLKKVVVSSTDSSDSDELNEYMKKWRNDRKKVNKAADESLSAFITDDDSDGDVIAYNLPPLSERITTRAPFINRREYATSVSEFLSGNPNDSKTPAGRIEVRRAPAEQIYNLSDSDSSTPPCARNFKTRDVSVIVLSDSDDSDNELNHIEKPNTFRTPKPPHSKTNTFITTPKPPHSKPNTFITPKLPHSMPNNSFKTPTTPSRSKENSKHPKSHVLKKFANAEHGSHTLSFLASLSADSNTTRCHPDALVYMKNFNKNRQELTERLYKLFNSKIFENKLPDSMAITWNTRMTKTAGFCYYKVDRSKASGRNARVELSTKVVDSPARLRDTLVHELCHAAAWLVSGYHGGHGPVWQAWASRATRVFPELPSIARCHNYEIACKYQYQCTKCGYSIGRHSKSLDTERKVCGRCLGRFELLATSARKPTSATTGSQPAALRTPRTPGPFAIFVKENYGSVKKNSQDLKHADVMRILGEKFKEMKTV